MGHFSNKPYAGIGKANVGNQQQSKIVKGRPAKKSDWKKIVIPKTYRCDDSSDDERRDPTWDEYKIEEEKEIINCLKQPTDSGTFL